MDGASKDHHNNLRHSFMLDDGVVFLNHGSFGATPRVVFEAYQQFQRRLENQPVRFLQRELPDLLSGSRATLADFTGCDADELVFVPNPTFAANTIARSLPLGPGDELLTTNHEYGACLFAFRFASQHNRFRIVEHSIPLPPRSRQTIVEQFWKSVNKNTKAIFLSHITSPTAITFPVEEICHRARESGIVTFIDGAHVPGQTALDLHAIDADFYAGACHKWLCAPKGASFLYARRDQQHRIEPLVVGWGWGDQRTMKVGSDFLDAHEWLGTHDPSAYLTVPTAIKFQQQNDWPAVRNRCRQVVRDVVERAGAITGFGPVCGPEWHLQMGLIEVSTATDLPQLKQRLYYKHAIEIPTVVWEGRRFLRMSIQAYNSVADGDAFLRALETELADPCRN